MRIFLFEILLALTAGSCSVFAWAPFGYWLAGMICYVILYRLLQRMHHWFKAAILGFAFSLGMQLSGHSWIYTSLHQHAGMSTLSAMLSMLVFASYYSCITGLFCGLWRVLCQFHSGRQSDCSIAPFLSGILFSVLLSLSEMLRGAFATGFNSLSFGYALIDTPMANFAPLLGVYGVSFCAYLIAVSLNICMGGRSQTKIIATANIALICSVSWGLGYLNWTQAATISYSFSLIQTGVEQENKFDPRFAKENTERLITAIEQNPADIILTPETAFAQRWTELSTEALNRLQNFSRLNRSHLFAGIATISSNADGYNSVVHIAPDSGADFEKYHKVRLMPFGEYSLWGFGWFEGNLRISFKKLSAGNLQQTPFHVGQLAIGSLICHETHFGDDARRWLPEVGAFINPANLAWFEDTIALGQSLQIARMRAKESGRPILRATNTGVTAYIDQKGVVVASLPSGVAGVLHGRLLSVTGITPYVNFSDSFVLAILIAMLVLTLMQQTRLKRW
jgi:apolipoprotein N-acyltransferase